MEEAAEESVPVSMLHNEERGLGKSDKHRTYWRPDRHLHDIVLPDITKDSTLCSSLISERKTHLLNVEINTVFIQDIEN